MSNFFNFLSRTNSIAVPKSELLGAAINADICPLELAHYGQHYLIPVELFDDDLHFADLGIAGVVEVDGFIALIGETTYQNGPDKLVNDHPEFDAFKSWFEPSPSLNALRR